MVDHVESPGRARITKVHTWQGCGTGKQYPVTFQDSVVSAPKPPLRAKLSEHLKLYYRIFVDHTLLFVAADICDPVLRSVFLLGKR